MRVDFRLYCASAFALIACAESHTRSSDASSEAETVSDAGSTLPAASDLDTRVLEQECSPAPFKALNCQTIIDGAIVPPAPSGCGNVEIGVPLDVAVLTEQRCLEWVVSVICPGYEETDEYSEINLSEHAVLAISAPDCVAPFLTRQAERCPDCLTVLYSYAHGPEDTFISCDYEIGVVALVRVPPTEHACACEGSCSRLEWPF